MNFWKWIRALVQRQLRGAISAHAREQLVAFDELLDQLAVDDHEEAAKVFMGWSSVAQALAELPDGAQPHVPAIMVKVMEAFDKVFPEETLQDVLAYLDIDHQGGDAEPTPAPPTADEGEPEEEEKIE